MLEASLFGVGTVLRLERDAWPLVKCRRQATNEDPPPPHALTPRGKFVGFGSFDLIVFTTRFDSRWGKLDP